MGLPTMGWGIPSKTLVNVLLITPPRGVEPAVGTDAALKFHRTSARPAGQLTIERYSKFPRTERGPFRPLLAHRTRLPGRPAGRLSLTPTGLRLIPA